MPKLPATRRGQLALVLIAAGTAIGGGVIAGSKLFAPSAAVKTTRTINLQHRYAKLQAAAGAKGATVAFLGPFKRGRCGPAVRIMEGALRLTTPPVRKAKASSCFGAATERQIKVFQGRHGIPKTGIYGTRTHKALSHAYTKRQREALSYIATVRLKKLRVNAILGITAHARAVQGLMQYCETGSLSNCGRRFVWPPWPDVPRHTDCSGYVSWIYFEAGLPDPNGLNYTGGYTQTLVVHGVAVRPGAPLHVGDLIFNGPSASNTTHVHIYIGHGLTSGHGAFGIHINQYNYRTIVAIRRYF